jgi:hypothetical protein
LIYKTNPLSEGQVWDLATAEGGFSAFVPGSEGCDPAGGLLKPFALGVSAEVRPVFQLLRRHEKRILALPVDSFSARARLPQILDQFAHLGVSGPNGLPHVQARIVSLLGRPRAATKYLRRPPRQARVGF